MQSQVVTNTCVQASPQTTKRLFGPGPQQDLSHQSIRAQSSCQQSHVAGLLPRRQALLLSSAMAQSPYSVRWRLITSILLWTLRWHIVWQVLLRRCLVSHSGQLKGLCAALELPLWMEDQQCHRG